MIRMIQRNLIIPRGDTGSFSIPVINNQNTGDIAVFTIFDALTRSKLFQKIIEAESDTLNIAFTHNDTVNLKPGKYLWDIKFYQNPQFINDELVNGTEVDSYYAGFTLPICEIRETGDNLLTSNEAPNAYLKPEQLDIITEAINCLNNAAAQAQESVNHYPKIENGYWYVWDAENEQFISTDVSAIGSGTSDYTDLTNKPSIESVTLSGNKTASDLGLAKASDLSEKQTKITASGILKGDGSGGVSTATAGTDYGTYSKPTGGIPSSDMTSVVQTSLGKADTAYQLPSGGIPASDLASGVIPSVPSASSSTPQPLGTAAAGSSADYSRADHVHAKPTYSKSDVGLENVDNVQQYSASNPPPYPVTSVNSQTGAVTLSIPSTAGDVGAIAAPTTAGTNGQVLTSDGNGGQSWQTLSGGGTSDYTDLTNKPQINSVTLSGNKSLSDLGLASASDLSGKQAKITVSGILKGDGQGNVSSAIAGTDYGTYNKPNDGIPSSDLASAVQTSLGKADTAYQKPSDGIPTSDRASGVVLSSFVTTIWTGTQDAYDAIATKDANTLYFIKEV